nr:hypothetical protein [Lachnospiraceae bacterium]
GDEVIYHHNNTKQYVKKFSEFGQEFFFDPMKGCKILDPSKKPCFEILFAYENASEFITYFSDRMQLEASNRDQQYY